MTLIPTSAPTAIPEIVVAQLVDNETGAVATITKQKLARTIDDAFMFRVTLVAGGRVVQLRQALLPSVVNAMAVARMMLRMHNWGKTHLPSISGLVNDTVAEYLRALYK